MSPKRPNTISVLVVDDHRVFAEALGVAIGLDPELSVDVATTTFDAVEAVRRIQPDVILLDLEMPGGGGLGTIPQIRAAHPSSRIVVISAYEDDIQKARALEAGAVGFVSKLQPMAELTDAVRAARAGEPLVDPDESARLARVLRHRRHQEATQRQRANRLTPRQLEILQLIADGVPTPEIAERLGMSPLTLRTHVQNILTRLGVHTKVEAVAVAIKHGKVSLTSTA